MNIYLTGAAGIAALWTVVHAVIGGRESERVLSKDTHLPALVRETMLLCWHMVTAFLGLMAVFLWFGAKGAEQMALAGLLMALAASGVGIVLAPLRGLSYRLLPQGWMFVPIAALSAWALWGGQVSG